MLVRKHCTCFEKFEINFVLFEPKPESDPENSAKWEKINKLCLHTIKRSLSNKLFDSFCHFTYAKDL